jgi:hypothetical protein
MAKISTYATDGTPSLADKVIGTEVENSNATKNYTISDILSLGSTIFAPALYYGSFYDTTTQTVTSGGIAAMQCNTTTITNGVSIQNQSEITFEYSGIYNIQFSAQLYRTSGGADAVTTIWLRQNGIDVADTATNITLKANSNYLVAAWNWIVEGDSGSYAQIMWTHNDNITIQYEPAGTSPVHPAVPSVIITANRVG